jgi:hypothetical protein
MAKSPRREAQLRRTYEEIPLHLLQDALDDMENYLDGRFYQRWAQWLLEGAPMGGKEYRIALEVCQQREQIARNMARTASA